MAQEPPVSESDKIIEEPDIMPMYTGGTAEMHRFISKTLRYPPDAVARDAQGLVVYTFVVEKDGTLSNFNIIHRADSLLNEEALATAFAKYAPLAPCQTQRGDCAFHKLCADVFQTE